MRESFGAWSYRIVVLHEKPVLTSRSRLLATAPFLLREKFETFENCIAFYLLFLNLSLYYWGNQSPARELQK